MLLFLLDMNEMEPGVIRHFRIVRVCVCVCVPVVSRNTNTSLLCVPPLYYFRLPLTQPYLHLSGVLQTLHMFLWTREPPITQLDFLWPTSRHSNFKCFNWTSKIVSYAFLLI